MGANAKKASQLGMPIGTAANRLRKMILFSILERHKENVCFRCGKIIDKVEDLSVDHKEAWLDVDVALFWDMNNVSFSHMRCNVGHARKPGKKMKVEGKVWCWSCKTYRDAVTFPPSVQDELTGRCTSCERKSKADWRSRSGKH